MVTATLVHRWVPWLLLIIAIPFTSRGAIAAQYITLEIKNPGTITETLKYWSDANTVEGRCVQQAGDTTPLGQMLTIPPRGSTIITMVRIDGHGCNGQNGGFYLDMAADTYPRIGVPGDAWNITEHAWKATLFNYSNNAELWEVQFANRYIGALVNNGGNKYTYTLAIRPKRNPITAYWRILCTPITCENTKLTVRVTTENTTTTVKSSETSKELVKAQEYGFTVSASKKTSAEAEKGGKAEVDASVSANYKNTSTDTEKTTILDSLTTVATQSIEQETVTEWKSVTYADLIAKNIQAIWQLYADVEPPILPGQPENRFTIGTRWVQCTSDSIPPPQFPGSTNYPANLCGGGLKK